MEKSFLTNNKRRIRICTSNNNHFVLCKRSQAWSLDVIVACVIFIIGLIILYVYAINYKGGSGEDLSKLFYDGNNVAEFLLQNDDFGILSQNIVNQTKLEDFYNANYNDKKKNFGVTSDFYFSLDNMEINGTSVSFVGKLNQTSVDTIVKITRFTIYKNKPVKLAVYTWK